MGAMWPGFVAPAKLREIYYASHIFLHPSETGSDGNQEGIPNSMLEAMATGLPVLATNHGGIPEAIENGVSGILVPERDYEALSQALLNAVQDRDLLIHPTLRTRNAMIRFEGTETVYHETVANIAIARIQEHAKKYNNTNRLSSGQEALRGHLTILFESVKQAPVQPFASEQAAA